MHTLFSLTASALFAAAGLATPQGESVSESGRAIDLLAEGLAGWSEIGDAIFTFEDGLLAGRVGGGAQSFLVSGPTFGDFRFELELKPSTVGNSGVQVRSQVRESGGLYGYQIEVDPSERAWSGGLYDEGRRGWLDDLSDNEPGRLAFKPGAWNHYAIECRGTWIRAWVNGVPTADYLDPLDLAGHIALQIHSGTGTDMRWRNLRLQDFGRRRWRPGHLGSWQVEGVWRLGAERFVVPASPVKASARPIGAATPLRFRLRDAEARLSLRFSGDGLAMQPSTSDAWKKGGWNDVALSICPGRFAVHVNEKLLRAGEATFVGFEVAPGTSPLSIEELELLSAPR